VFLEYSQVLCSSVGSAKRFILPAVWVDYVCFSLQAFCKATALCV